MDYTKLIADLNHADELTADHRILSLTDRAASALEELTKPKHTDYSELVKALRSDAGNQYTSDAVAAIEALQAEAPKRGEWVEENRRPRSSKFVCSECHRTAYDPQPTRDKAWRKRCRYAYCPNCGAKMEVQDER